MGKIRSDITSSITISSVICVLCCIIELTGAAKLPAGFQRCSLKDPNVNECVRQGVQGAIQQLRAGAPELGIGTFEPLEIPELIIGEGTGPVNVQQNFKNVKLHGLTNSKVLEERLGLDKNMLWARSITPELRLEAEYSMRGRVLLLPVFGDGPCNVTLLNLKINHTLLGEPFKKKGKTFLKFHEYQITLRPERVVFHFANLFNGNEQLGREINKVLNDNWDAVFTDVRGGYEKGLGLVFQDLANRVFTKVAMKDIFLDYEEKP